jgi:FADH2 O2-dependent halogenase
VRIKSDSQTIDLPCKLVVDASGRDTLLGRQLRLKEKDALFNQFAVHAWYEEVDRGHDHTADHIHIYFLPIEKGWVWQIPITETITSIGVVTEKNDFSKAGMDVADFFNTHVQSNPNLSHAMRNARQVKGFKFEGDYSYSMSNFVGDRFVLIGDAARFVDPIFSSGVSVALHSAKFASEQIVMAFEANDFSKEILLPYEQKLRKGVEIWYEFIRLYYKLLPLFTHFIQKPQYRMQLFRLLQGEVFERDETPVLEAMRNYIATVEENESHLLRGQLLNVPV